jgi:hypothetical protein
LTVDGCTTSPLLAMLPPSDLVPAGTARGMSPMVRPRKPVPLRRRDFVGSAPHARAVRRPAPCHACERGTAAAHAAAQKLLRGGAPRRRTSRRPTARPASRPGTRAGAPSPGACLGSPHGCPGPATCRARAGVGACTQGRQYGFPTAAYAGTPTQFACHRRSVLLLSWPGQQCAARQPLGPAYPQAHCCSKDRECRYSVA